MATSTFEREVISTGPSERPETMVAPGSGQYTDRQCVLIREAFQALYEDAHRLGLADRLWDLEILRRRLGMDD